MEFEAHSVSQSDINDTNDAQSLGGSSDDTQSLGGGFTDLSTLQNVIHPHMPHHVLLASSNDEAEDNDDAMSLGGYTEDEADDLHPFSMLEVQAKINIPSSPKMTPMGMTTFPTMFAHIYKAPILQVFNNISYYSTCPLLTCQQISLNHKPSASA
ncbi:hypothetical protein BDN71DRAFT_1426717 [Pleurotus eryngii]|uniref:Uncharacterized protein n=1 Tax=Pleurotus eryngii TaxID=5323 RepID=A0A9P6DDP8_PLEER|nr:hypothetical protein BDN71DRAFT_1426717 [Pleurotus eryngii]